MDRIISKIIGKLIEVKLPTQQPPVTGREVVTEIIKDMQTRNVISGVNSLTSRIDENDEDFSITTIHNIKTRANARKILKELKNHGLHAIIGRF